MNGQTTPTQKSFLQTAQTRFAILVLFFIFIAGSFIGLPAKRLPAQGHSAAPQSGAPAAAIAGKVYSFQEITQGVYLARGTGTMVTGSNITVIIGSREAMVVDTGTSPAAARGLLQDLQLVSSKPVRYVVNTHFHYDHTDGNQVYAGKARIVAHEYVKYAIENLRVLEREPFKTYRVNAVNAVQNLENQIAAEADPTRKAALAQQLSGAKQSVQELEEIKPTPPGLTYTKQMKLNLGGREVHLLFLGRGHTNGDTVVYLPKEKIVCTGDLMESRIAYMGDAQFDEWIVTLDALKQLDFNTVLPGQGTAFTGKELITAFQGYLSDVVAKGAKLKQEGLSAEDAARTIDLVSHQDYFPDIKGPGAEVRGMRRLYEWLDSRTMKSE
ncbi:MAG TPA: MBL fold metallo-hydrolase [Terriglobales bacterium]|nr:MBL fold metallo-hydrolase [Terriglobales bacterium]